jgi:MFS family permease
MSEENANIEKLSLNDLKEFSFGYWLMNLDGALVYGLTTIASSIGTNELSSRFSYSQSQASAIFVLPYLFPIFGLPLLGTWCDKYGKRMTINFLSGYFLLIMHLIYLFTPDCN